MPSNYYPETDVEDTSTNAANETMGAGGTNNDEAADEDMDKSQENDGETTLVPKSLFYGGDVEPGQIEKVKVIHVYDDEVEIQCIRDTEGEKNGNVPKQSYMSGAESKLDDIAMP